MEKENVFKKVSRLEADYTEAKQKYLTSKKAMEDFVNSVEDRLKSLREKDRSRISELEYLLKDTPGEKIRRLDAEIEADSEKVRNINNDPYGAFRKRLEDKKAERERLLKDMQSAVATSEEREITELRRKTHTVTENEKDTVFEMYETAMANLQKMNSIRSEMRIALEQLKEAAKVVRTAVVGDGIADLGDRHINGTKEKFNAIERMMK